MDIHTKKQASLDPFLVTSIASSINSMALVLRMFLQSEALQNCTGKVKMGLYLYHLAEVSFRVLVLALLGFMLGRYSFVAAAGCFVVRAVLRLLLGKTDMPVSLLVVSVVVDSAWSSLWEFRAASLFTALEGLLVMLLVCSVINVGHLRRSIEPTSPLWLSMIILPCSFFLIKLGLQRVVESQGKYRQEAGKRAEYDHTDEVELADLPDEVVNPAVSAAGQVLKAVF